MTNFIWLIVGSVMGYVWAINNPSTEHIPRQSAILTACILACVVVFGLGRRAKAEATATAVASAVANAQIAFDAQLAATANAVAQNAVTIYLRDAEQISTAQAREIAAEYIEAASSHIPVNEPERVIGYL